MKIRSKNRIGRIPLIITIFVWLLLFSIPLLFTDFRETLEWEHIFKIWKEYSVVFVLFLINRFILLPHMFFKGRRYLYFISVLSLIILLSAGIYIHARQEQKIPKEIVHSRPAPGPPGKSMHRMPPPHLKTMPGPRDFIPPYANLLILSVLMLGFDTGLMISIQWIKLGQDRISLEKENLENKMAFLKNQISPHFFMNTLNNIHSLVDISKEEAKEAIIRLSRLMSYMLYDINTKKVSVQREMEFVRSYVDLMRLRFTDQVDVKLYIEEPVPEVLIPPLLTISFIENAFKYGVSYENQSYVHIYFSFSKNQMNFIVENSYFGGKGEEGKSGIGITNTRKRLDLIYGDSYDLNLESSDEGRFRVKLNIPV